MHNFNVVAGVAAALQAVVVAANVAAVSEAAAVIPTLWLLPQKLPQMLLWF